MISTCIIIIPAQVQVFLCGPPSINRHLSCGLRLFTVSQSSSRSALRQDPFAFSSPQSSACQVAINSSCKEGKWKGQLISSCPWSCVNCSVSMKTQTNPRQHRLIVCSLHGHFLCIFRGQNNQHQCVQVCAYSEDMCNLKGFSPWWELFVQVLRYDRLLKHQLMFRNSFLL